jgi:hypothetical protein
VKRHSPFEKIVQDFEDIANGTSIAQGMAWGVIIVTLFFTIKYIVLEVFG